MLEAVPVTTGLFEPFGQLIEVPDQPGRRAFTDALSFGSDRDVVLSATHALPGNDTIVVDYLERHLGSSQTFLPLDVSRWVVIVGTNCDPDSRSAFLFGPGQGATIARGVWHHGLTVLDRAASFAVLMWKNGETDDEFRDVEPSRIVVPALRL